MALGIDPTVDYAFKRLFGDPNHAGVLVHLLNALFEGQFEVEGVEILTPFLEKDFETDKLAVLDLRVRDTQRRVYNLEMQTTVPAGLPNRLAYYLSCIYGDQLREGDSYLKLAPAIGICFLNQVMLSETSSFHTRFRLCSLEEGLELTDHLEVHLLELPKYNGIAGELSRASGKERWAYFLKHVSGMTLDEIGRLFGEPAFLEAGGVLNMISKSEEERLRYEMRAKAVRDHLTDIEAARLEGLETGLEQGLERGLEKGLERGLERGRESGQWVGRIQTLQELLGDAVSTSEELQTVDIETLRKMAESLQTRLRARP